MKIHLGATEAWCNSRNKQQEPASAGAGFSGTFPTVAVQAVCENSLEMAPYSMAPRIASRRWPFVKPGFKPSFWQK